MVKPAGVYPCRLLPGKYKLPCGNTRWEPLKARLQPFAALATLSQRNRTLGVFL